MAQNDPHDGEAHDDTEYNRRSFLTGAGSASMVGLLASTGLVSADDDGRDPGPKEDELLIGVSSSVSDIEAEVGPEIPGDAWIEHTNETIHYAVISLPESTPESARETIIDTLEDIDQIEYAEENATLEALSQPNDPYYGQQHAPQQVNCEQAWETTYGSDDVVISIVDQGIQYDHPVLADNMDDSVSDHGNVFVGRGSDPYPVSGNEQHGTHVGGIAAAGTDNGTGHAGISNCSMLSARALDQNGQGSLSDIADAIQWSVDAGADIINLSLGSSSGFRTLAAACQYAADNDVLLVGAAGNSSAYGAMYPAAYDEVVAVSALNSNDSLASFSNYGPAIDLAAPGSQVISAVPWDNYTRMSGTSMSAPVVAGVAGLVLSAYPDLTGAELRAHLQSTAVDVGLSSNAQGHGRVDAGEAVTTVPEGYTGETPSDGTDGDNEDEENEGDDDEQDDQDEQDDVAGRLLAFITEPEANSAAYEFTAEGAVEFADAPYESPSGGNIEGGTYTSEDFIDEDGDTVHAGGITGGGHGDAFDVDGAVTDIDLEQSDVMWVELDGEEMTPEEIIEETGGSDDDDDSSDEPTERLLAFITETDASNAGYEFTADGPVEFTEAPYESPSGGSIEGGTYTSEDFIDDDSDPVRAGGITGGGHGDAFTVTGPIHSIDLEQPDVMWVELEGDELSPEEIIDETGGDGDDDETGGDGDDDETPNCGDQTDGASADGELEGGWQGDSDRYTYALRTDSPCGATISLESSGGADVTLYLNTDGSVPDQQSYEESVDANGDLTLDLEGDEHLGLRVHASNGSATYAFEIEERGR
ncbi:S8 family serine peptidase [Natronolimnobius sp. AArcel1]|uniref:S8 family serine peptidase n=1 Tax=Natronolimnobius sp. AArcel1 TaxID=1679093 RepID=UPI0013ED5564|nr:S8 family serine peptidase [Natronolimnobius sp. AArcel1]NGM69344.1 S8 family serine peptidase [Natronolimnobius sp. AArcel1]